MSIVARGIIVDDPPVYHIAQSPVHFDGRLIADPDEQIHKETVLS